VAGRAGEQDPGDQKGVEDLGPDRPDPGRGQELEVQPGAVADRLPAPQELAELGQDRTLAARATKGGGVDPGEPDDRLRHRAAGVDQALQAAQDAVRREGDRPDLDDAVVVGVESGRFEVERDVFGQGGLRSSARILL